jgi:hypothetical protein
VQGAADAAYIACTFQQQHIAVTTDIGQHIDATFTSADGKQRIIAYIEGEEVTGIGDVSCTAHTEPLLFPDGIQLKLEKLFRGKALGGQGENLVGFLLKVAAVKFFNRNGRAYSGIHLSISSGLHKHHEWLLLGQANHATGSDT